ncbi:hypothetical protein Tco_1150645 [Tanacetum coccineum]
MPNTGKPVYPLKYSRAISCLMYAMMSTRHDIAYAVGRLSMFTSNPSRQHWHAIIRVFNIHPYGCWLHKEALQAISGLTSLGVTSEVRADPQLSSVVSASTTKPVYSTFSILHSESTLGHDALATFTAEVGLGITAPND